MESLQEALTKTLGNVLSANTPQDSAQNTRMDFDTATDSEVHVDVQNVEVFQVVDEYVEREKRKNNLIIHNLPEPTDVSSNEQRAVKDTETISDLFHTEFNLANAKIQRITRLGAIKPNSSRPRLLLVEMGDISTKRSILKQATKLRKSSKWSNIYISPDLTPKERSLHKKLRDELKTRKNAGEKDLYIKRGKIITRPPGNGTSDQTGNSTSGQTGQSTN